MPDLDTAGCKDTAAADGWRQVSCAPSLPEAQESVKVGRHLTFWRKLLAYSGPGFLIAVGYMDPGNWATDLAGGAQFGYTLLSVILVSNLMAVLLQYLCIKLGVVTAGTLAQACRDHYSTPTVWFLWGLSEIAIAACDLAEIVGSAIALELLFGIPLFWGCCLTSLDVLAVLYLQNKGFRYLEAVVATLIGLIGACFGAELWFSHPSLSGMAWGFLPQVQVLTNKDMLYVAIGILGATVMPHNLYLHSSLAQSRDFPRTTPAGKKEALRFGAIDSASALTIALCINAAILILAAAAFHWSGHQGVAEIQDAYKLLSPLLGVGVASLLFAVALLASGQNSTLTGTLAGQIVMEGFLHLRMAPWLRRLLTTRGLALAPTLVIIGIFGEGKTTQLIVGQPGGLEHATRVRRLAADAFYERAGEDGRVRQCRLAQAAGLDRDLRHHRAEREACLGHAAAPFLSSGRTLCPCRSLGGTSYIRAA